MTLAFDDGTKSAAEVPLTLPNGLRLTYGQINALGADYYGDPDKPVSDRKPSRRFLAAYDSLAKKKASVREAHAILNIMRDEVAAVRQSLRQPDRPASVYRGVGNILDGKWNAATGGGVPGHRPICAWYPPGRYFRLLHANWDHFGEGAITAYSAGHALALTLARKAGHKKKAESRHAGLTSAYAVNAFADNFLLDLFSAGHLRTPRKALYDMMADHRGVSDVVTGKMAQCMHDEDCHFGLAVRNRAGDTWKAFGDRKLVDASDTENLGMAVRALQTSVDEVAVAFRTGQVPTAYAALGLAPDPAAVADWTGAQAAGNHSPLFIVEDGVLKARRDIADPRCFQWARIENNDGNIVAIEVLYYQWRAGFCYPSPPTPLHGGLIQVYVKNNKFGIATYEPTASAFLSQSTDNATGEKAGHTLRWLTGFADSNLSKTLFRLYDKGGRLGITTFGQDKHGKYVRLKRNKAAGASSANIGFLAMDINGDGMSDIVQFTDNDGDIGATIYTSDGKGGYRHYADNGALGTGADSALAFFPSHALGEQSETPGVIALVNDAGRLQAQTFVSEHRQLETGATYALDDAVSDSDRYTLVSSRILKTDYITRINESARDIDLRWYRLIPPDACDRHGETLPKDENSRTVGWISGVMIDIAQGHPQLVRFYLTGNMLGATVIDIFNPHCRSLHDNKDLFDLGDRFEHATGLRFVTSRMGNDLNDDLICIYENRDGMLSTLTFSWSKARSMLACQAVSPSLGKFSKDDRETTGVYPALLYT